LSCRKGVFHAGKNELDDFANGKVAAIAPVAYGTADGMMTRECSGGGDPAGWRATDGTLWFPTIKGVAVIDPQQIRMNTQPPPVVIEQINVGDQSVAPAAKIELPAGKTSLEFYYTAPSSSRPIKFDSNTSWRALITTGLTAAHAGLLIIRTCVPAATPFA